MNPLLAVFISGLAFSFYPLMNAFGTLYVSPIMFSVINHATTILMCSIVVSIIFKGPQKAFAVVMEFFNLPKGVMAIGLFSGIAIYMGGLFFIFALQFMSSAGATMIAEMWPALAVFITPILIRKNWEKISSLDLYMLIVCLVGVVFMAASEKGQSFSEFISSPFFLQGGHEFVEYMGVLMAVLSAYCFAFSIVSRAHFANSLPQDFRDKYFNGGVTIKEAMYTYIVVYLASSPLVIVLLLFMENASGFNIAALAPGLLNGIFLTITSSLYSYALLKSDSPNINILWYFAPLLASIWLVLFGFSEATEMIILGGALIILANVSLILIGRQKKKQIVPIVEADEPNSNVG